MSAPYSKYLRQAAKIADDRAKQYGDVSENFEDIRRILDFTFGIQLSKVAICKVMIAVKQARELHKPKQDNRTDTTNYYAILSHLIDEGES